jgi:putative PIN family toxin of toxin-antitoxin system
VIRAVLDPGVLIAAFNSPAGIPARILRAWERGMFELMVSPMLLDELLGTLLRPKFGRYASNNDVVMFVEALRLAGSAVDDPSSVEAISRDPNDDYLIALARACGAHVIVSSDKDLTSLRDLAPPVVRPLEFLSTLGEL